NAGISLGFKLGQNPRGGNQVMAPHLFGKTRQSAEPLVKFAPYDEGAAPLLAPDIADLHEFLVRLPDGYLADFKAPCNLLLTGEALIRPPSARLNLGF